MAGLNNTPSGERIAIGFFGNRNAGKSSLINRVTGQELSVVSDVPGTTTDPVKKAMELLPLGPVMLYDTPGIDDEGALGEQRVAKTREILGLIDIAVVVRAEKDEDSGISELIKTLESKGIPYIIAYNKSDTFDAAPELSQNELLVSAKTGQGIEELKGRLAQMKPQREERRLISDKINAGDVVVLVVPIDESAPKGRLILPQQQTIRDIIDSGAIPLVCRPQELSEALEKLTSPPALVITDSQVFKEVERIIPRDLLLTSFSIIFARYKGELDALSEGAKILSELKSGDKVLISEGCTHHRQCGDIGSVKIPRLIKRFAGAEPEFHFTSGGEFPQDISSYRAVIHCGGCMLGEREMHTRIERALEQGIPIVNYGVAIAYMNGILPRALEIFK